MIFTWLVDKLRAAPAAVDIRRVTTRAQAQAQAQALCRRRALRKPLLVAPASGGQDVPDNIGWYVTSVLSVCNDGKHETLR